VQRKLKYGFGLLVVLFAFCSASGQSPAIDSLLKLMANARDDTTKIMLNIRAADIMRGYDVERAMKYVDAIHPIIINLDNDYYRAYYYKARAECLFDMAKYSEAQSNEDTTIVLFDRLIGSAGHDAKAVAKFKLAKADCFTVKGLVAAKQYRYHESFQYYLQAIAAIENLPGTEKNDVLATLYIDIASNYYELEQFDESLKYDRQVQAYLDSNDNIDMYVFR
jgi:hypothetical protein